MRQQIKLQFQLFFKNKILIFIYIVTMIIALGGITFFIVNQADTSFLFYVVTRFIFYANLLFCVMGYMFMIYARQNNIEDIILVSGQGKNKYFVSSLIVVFALMIIFNIGILLLLLLSAKLNNQIDILILMLKNFYFMNILFPQITSIIIAVMLSTLKNIYVGSLLLVGFVFLTSPYIEIFQWSEKPLFPIDQIVNYIHLPFSYFLQNSDWSIDYLYGFQNEFYKTFVFIFWWILSMVIIKRDIMIKNKVILGISGVILVMTIYMIYIPQSMARYNKKWDGAYIDIIAYDIVNNQNQYTGEKKVNYKIDKYNLDIDIKEKLYVQGSLDIVSTLPNDEYNLTLYRGYKINYIRSENLLSYEQKGDYINIKFDKPVVYQELEIQYTGFHYNLYSNYQAAVLPGYFAWYPMAGEKQNYITFKDTSIANYGYNPYNRAENSNFNISIKANYPILTNLNKADSGKYRGISDSMTIVGGQMIIEDNNQYLNYCPLYLSNELPYEKFQEWRESTLKEIDNKIKEIFNVIPNFKNKKIISVSNVLSRNSNLGNYAEFDDYLIISNNGIFNEYDILTYYIYNSSLDPQLKDCLSLIGLRAESKDEYIKSIVSTLEEFMKQTSINDDELSKEMYEKYKHLYQNITEKIDKKQIDQYLKEIGEELFD